MRNDTAIILSADTDVELQSLVDAFYLKYTLWFLLDCFIINPTKSNFLLLTRLTLLLILMATS